MAGAEEDSIEASYEKVCALVGQRWVKFVSEDAQTWIAIVKGALDDLLNSKMPKCHKLFDANPFYKKVKIALSLFLSFQKADEPKTHGVVAAVQMLEELSTKGALGQEIDYEQLDPLGMFQFLLPEKYLHELGALRDKAIEQAETLQEQAETVGEQFMHVILIRAFKII